jgi:hypothetical protein
MHCAQNTMTELKDSAIAAVSTAARGLGALILRRSANRLTADTDTGGYGGGIMGGVYPAPPRHDSDAGVAGSHLSSRLQPTQKAAAQSMGLAKSSNIGVVGAGATTVTSPSPSAFVEDGWRWDDGTTSTPSLVEDGWRFNPFEPPAQPPRPIVRGGGIAASQTGAAAAQIDGKRKRQHDEPLQAEDSGAGREQDVATEGQLSAAVSSWAAASSELPGARGAASCGGGPTTSAPRKKARGEATAPAAAACAAAVTPAARPQAPPPPPPPSDPSGARGGGATAFGGCTQQRPPATLPPLVTEAEEQDIVALQGGTGKHIDGDPTEPVSVCQVT